MDINNRTKVSLPDCQIFAGITAENILEITRMIRNRIVPAHTIICRQGDPGNNFYIINSGKVKIFRESKDGIVTELTRLGPGESFGELSLLTGKPRSAYVETLEETELSVVSKDKFDRIIKDYPTVASILVNQVSSWLTQSNVRFEKEVEHKARVPGMSWLDFLIVFGLSILFGIFFNLSNPNGIKLIPKSPSAEKVTTLTPASALERYREGEALFVDAIPSNFFEQQHIKGAINMPPALFDIMYMMEFSGIDKDREIIVCGRTISRLYDEDVATKLILRGHKNTRILDGGLSKWKKEGGPVEP